MEHFSHRPQVHERLTTQVSTWLRDQLGAAGVGVVVEVEHLCMTLRGVQAPGTTTVASSLLGVLREDARTARSSSLSPALRAEAAAAVASGLAQPGGRRSASRQCRRADDQLGPCWTRREAYRSTESRTISGHHGFPFPRQRLSGRQTVRNSRASTWPQAQAAPLGTATDGPPEESVNLPGIRHHTDVLVFF
jgi:hypothetical protein